jgi:hypothetical protein
LAFPDRRFTAGKIDIGTADQNLSRIVPPDRIGSDRIPDGITTDRNQAIPEVPNFLAPKAPVSGVLDGTRTWPS